MFVLKLSFIVNANPIFNRAPLDCDNYKKEQCHMFLALMLFAY